MSDRNQNRYSSEYRKETLRKIFELRATGKEQEAMELIAENIWAPWFPIAIDIMNSLVEYYT